LHHIFLRVGFSPVQSLGIISLAGLVVAAIGILGEVYQVPEWVMFAGFIVLFVGYCSSLRHIWVLSKLIRRWRGVS
jgi:UDP-GlcNAc:undecaprenyl-phosphate GlcNAc-1-phosphate transferase